MGFEQPKRAPRYFLALLVALALLDFRDGRRAPIAFAATSASCSESAAEYIARLDPLFDVVRRELTPFIALKDIYFPLRSCNIDELLSIVSKSRYITEISISFGGSHIIKFVLSTAKDELSIFGRGNWGQSPFPHKSTLTPIYQFNWSAPRK